MQFNTESGRAKNINNGALVTNLVLTSSDLVTGLLIQCRRWELEATTYHNSHTLISIYFLPTL